MDLISRQAAIEALGDMPMSWADTDAEIQAQEDWKQHREALLKLPTAEKKGEWIPVVDGNYIVWECSECHVESDAWTDFCPICGSRNIEEMDEEAFEKALEEFRKNPKTYTLDEVEAELDLTAEPSDEAAFEAGYTKAQMELKDAYKPRKGKWIPVTNGRGGHECDQCHEYAPSWQTGEERLTNYCSNCGARMEEIDGKI